jgi:predicted transposase YdaD
MPDLTDTHDRFFAELPSRPGAAADFLAYYLPPGIASLLDLSAPELVKDSFVNGELRQSCSDLLYRVKLKHGGDAIIYILIEHKTNPDELVGLELLRNEVRIWEAASRHGAEKPYVSASGGHIRSGILAGDSALFLGGEVSEPSCRVRRRGLGCVSRVG